jgi:hypothetical protein
MTSLLIIGTSHTSGYFLLDGREHTLPEQDRWFGKLLHNDITILGFPGITAQQQVWLVNEFLKNNPDKTFDAAILEGRLPHSRTASIPYANIEDRESPAGLEFHTMSVDHKNVNRKVRHIFEPWLENYVVNELSTIDTIASNNLTCDMLASIAKKVCFISASGFMGDANDHKYYPYSMMLFEKYGIHKISQNYYRFCEDETESVPSKYLYECHHLNKDGNTIVQSSITESISEYLGI